MKRSQSALAAIWCLALVSTALSGSAIASAEGRHHAERHGKPAPASSPIAIGKTSPILTFDTRTVVPLIQFDTRTVTPRIELGDDDDTNEGNGHSHKEHAKHSDD